MVTTVIASLQTNVPDGDSTCNILTINGHEIRYNPNVPNDTTAILTALLKVLGL